MSAAIRAKKESFTGLSHYKKEILRKAMNKASVKIFLTK